MNRNRWPSGGHVEVVMKAGLELGHIQDPLPRAELVDAGAFVLSDGEFHPDAQQRGTEPSTTLTKHPRVKRFHELALPTGSRYTAPRLRKRPAISPETFGHRFLLEFRRLGGSTRKWPERAVILLDQADRRQFTDALRKVSSETATQLLVAAHTAEPERLAQRAVELTKAKEANAELMMLLGVLAILP